MSITSPPEKRCKRPASSPAGTDSMAHSEHPQTATRISCTKYTKFTKKNLNFVPLVPFVDKKFVPLVDYRNPPATCHVSPVIHAASADARNTTAGATSAGLPILPSGVCDSTM